MTSVGTNLSKVAGTPFPEGMPVIPVLERRALPQAQAGFAPWGGPALCTNTGATWNPVPAEELDRRSRIGDVAVCALPPAADRGERIFAQKEMRTGTRAVNRLLMSLWLLMLPVMWPSSDWIGLIILSQVFLVAANLIRPAGTSAKNAALPEGVVSNMNDGEGSAEG